MVPTGFLSDFKNPNYPCDTDRPKVVGEYLAARNFLDRDEQVRRLTAAPTPGRNATWRVETTTRTFMVKQFRPWAPNGQPAPTPEERFRAECQFYRTARIADGLGHTLADLLHHDCRAGCVILEDVGATDATRMKLTPQDAEKLAWFLVALHHHSQSVPAGAHYRSREVVSWQRAHLFHQSCPARRRERGRWLARFAAAGPENQRVLDQALAALDVEGSSLVHGHFTASNWVRTPAGTLRVVDAEFSFFGPPEFDVGAFLASLLFTGEAPEVIRAGLAVLTTGCMRYDARLAAGFAAVQLCDLLENDTAPGRAPRGPAASALLRRLTRVVETGSLDALLPRKRSAKR